MGTKTSKSLAVRKLGPVAGRPGGSTRGSKPSKSFANMPFFALYQEHPICSGSSYTYAHFRGLMKLCLPVCTALFAVVLLADPAAAQDGYFFGTPKLTLALHLGAARPDARDEIFQFMTSELTLDRDDFASAAVGGDVSYRIHPRVDVQIGAGVARSSKGSEFRAWLDENNQPIEQVTRLERVPLTAGLKLYVLPRGRELGKYAWVPARLSPYVGGGAGVTWYRLEQSGDFVDHQTQDIFTDRFVSKGAAATLNVFGGSELWLLTRVALNAEARYAWGSADLKDSFQDFQKIDLRGLQLTTGLTVRF